MRVIQTSGDLKVHAVAGSYVVMFGMNLPEAECDGLLGFSLHRVSHAEQEAHFLEATYSHARIQTSETRIFSEQIERADVAH